uniref:FLYWCH-type domain-containing protein n=1 Tax=Tetranychus urticae TaxID=32264 RepID=T1KRQ7_TETUR
MECQYVATQRGGIALVYEGHRYNKVRDGKDGTVYWRCSRDRQCPGRAVTVNNRVKKANNKHNHPAEAGIGGVPGATGSGSVGLLRNGSTASSNFINSHNNNNANSNQSSLHQVQAQAHQHHTSGSSSSAGLSPPSSGQLGGPLLSDVTPIISPRVPSGLTIQEVLNAQTAVAATAAVSFPTLMQETLKYIAFASGNHQFASFAASMANFGCPNIETLERSLCRNMFTNEGLYLYNTKPTLPTEQNNQLKKGKKRLKIPILSCKPFQPNHTKINHPNPLSYLQPIPIKAHP